jgi:hypothetical protein
MEAIFSSGPSWNNQIYLKISRYSTERRGDDIDSRIQHLCHIYFIAGFNFFLLLNRSGATLENDDNAICLPTKNE